MRTRGRDSFGTVKTEGAILPAELLRRIAGGDRDLPGLTPEAYHLARSERLNEAATRAWNRMQGAWESFKAAADKLPDTDPGTGLTRERWLLILFQELGYGRLTTHRAFEIEGKTYPISHLWQNTPIHLIGCNVELDRRARGVAGAARVSPHSLLQELLNRSDDHLWGFVSNGLRLRILRDNVSLTRAAYVEFDLAGMMDGEAYSDFLLLYLLCHQSRVEVPEGKTPEHCWLEKWYNTAATEGVRALDRLREGVQNAIEAFGAGFLAHPTNGELKRKLRDGQLDKQDYFRQVLRQVYRLLFLFVAEDRGLLFDPSAPAAARKLYADHYSTQRLRTLAGKRRGTRHPDLFRSLGLVFGELRTGCAELALPALGSFLFSERATPDLDDADIANTDLLAAVRHLAFTVDRNVLRPVNYRNLGSEELGSVYESLLEMHPETNLEAATFALSVAAGSERKTTGSYYTPSSLVNCLLDSALDPVLDEACKKPDPEAALLDLKICDPACGSGHFLISAAHRIAKRLAAIRAGEDEPAPEAIQHALRDVVGQCIYGVDLNPLAVELCKINLWLEALEPGKPLTFLDHHIQCGHSLLGATPALIKEGIPDDAFKPIEGDMKEVSKSLKADNRLERKTGQRRLFAATASDQLGDLTTAFASLAAEDDSTSDALTAKETHYQELVRSAPYENARLLADAWCAAFVCEKVSATGFAVTEASFRRWRESPHAMAPHERQTIIELREQYQFFHWHLAFPDVFRLPAEDETPTDEQTGWSGGFDCILGNPPWETLEFKEKEWFAAASPDIAKASTDARKRKIADLAREEPALHAKYKAAVRQAQGERAVIRDTGRYRLCATGKINTFSIFAELKRGLLNPRGRVGCIVPSGIATDDTTKFFFQDLMKTGSLVSLYSFENEEFVFPEIHHATKFCLLTMAAPRAVAGRVADFVFFARQVSYLAEDERHFSLSADDIALLNPNTGTCPIFRSKCDAELTKYIYRRVPVLIREARDRQPAENPWGVSFRQGLFNMSSDSDLFRTAERLRAEGCALEGNTFRGGDETYLPLYEGKMFWHFDHRFGTYEGQTEAQANQGKLPELTPQQHLDPDFLPLPRYWVAEEQVSARAARGSEVQGDEHADRSPPRWFVAFRDVTSAVVVRTAVFAVIPPVAVGHKAPLLHTLGTAMEACTLLATLNSFVFDFSARQSVGGSAMSYFILKQLPVPTPEVCRDRCPWGGTSTLAEWMLPRALALSCTAWDLTSFGADCGYDGPPFRWDEQRRLLIRCELDAALFHLYLGTPQEWQQNGTNELFEYLPTPRQAAHYIMDTFRIVREREEAAHGHYRTKDTILEIYDEMAEAIRTGRPYQTRLDPPPGPPADEHGNFPPLPEWKPGQPRPANWPPHIHPPRAEEVPR